MKKINWILVCVVILFVGFLSGCQEPSTTTENNISNKIDLESDVVELAYANINQHIEGTKTVQVDVEYLFKNVADRIISIEITAEFYDENNNLIYTGGPKYMTNLPVGYVETNILPVNIMSYSGEDAYKVDHIKIVVEEYLGT